MWFSLAQLFATDLVKKRQHEMRCISLGEMLAVLPYVDLNLEMTRQVQVCFL